MPPTHSCLPFARSIAITRKKCECECGGSLAHVRTKGGTSSFSSSCHLPSPRYRLDQRTDLYPFASSSKETHTQAHNTQMVRSLRSLPPFRLRSEETPWADSPPSLPTLLPTTTTTNHTRPTKHVQPPAPSNARRTTSPPPTSTTHRTTTTVTGKTNGMRIPISWRCRRGRGGRLIERLGRR